MSIGEITTLNKLDVGAINVAHAIIYIPVSVCVCVGVIWICGGGGWERRMGRKKIVKKEQYGQDKRCVGSNGQEGDATAALLTYPCLPWRSG